MDIRSIARMFLPPLFVNAVRSVKRPPKNYLSYSDALAECGAGYDSAELAKIVVAKNAIVSKKISDHVAELSGDALRSLITVATNSRAGETINVLDFGGGGGYHYACVRALLPKSQCIRWHVVETAEMVKQARRLENDELKFYESIELAAAALERVDTVFVSGSIQYTPEPQEFIKKLLKVKARSIFIARTPLTISHAGFIQIQASKISANGPGPLPDGIEDCTVYYPVTVMNKLDFESVLTEDYSIAVRFVESETMFSSAGGLTKYYGYYCTSK